MGNKGKVTGIGGVFFKSDNPTDLRRWYNERLGLDAGEYGMTFFWREQHQDNIGYSVWNPFRSSTDYFAPSPEPFMVNFRVEHLEELLEELRSAGVEVVGEIAQEPNGKFAWILDPDGNKLELWEPVPSKEDPYLNPPDS
ncbi:MAG: VOC family protein [Myxococcota bacterium]